jgi:LexA-binding, inner membrane-associated putative hydrolase
MPDWIVHITVAWILCRLLSFKYPQFDPNNTILVMIGSVLPDAVKVGLLFDLLGHDWWNYISALHLPLGTLILAGLLSLLFQEKKAAFLFLSLGILTHFLLDLLLIQPGDGIYLFYPISWLGFHLDLVPTTDYNITIIALAIALLVYLVTKWYERKNKNLAA